MGRAQVDAELADELAVREAHNRRIAAEDVADKAQRELSEIEEINRELGPRHQRDHVHDELDKHRTALKEANKELAAAKREEIKAEAAERIRLKRRRDLDPAAAKHDPELRQQAEEEFGRRMERVSELDEFMQANEADIAKAKAKVAEKDKAFREADPGRVDSFEQAKHELNKAEHELERVSARNEDALKAKNNQLERMQELDRIIAPDDYPELTGDKGRHGERRSRESMERNGYEFRGSSKEPKVGASKEQGLDGVFEKPTATADEPRHVVVESKYGESKPTQGQKRTEWVDDNLDHTVGPDQAKRMRQEGYEYWVVKYDPVTGRVLPPKKMWVWKPNGKIGPNGRILGDAHLIAPE